MDGTAVSSGASFTKELAANESVKVYIESGSTSAATKITLTNVVLVSDVNATATFVPAENGTYTVDGKLITEEYSNTQSSMTAYQVVATRRRAISSWAGMMFLTRNISARLQRLR